MISTHRLISFDETPLFFRKCTPSEPLRGVVFIQHGMGEHGGRYQPIGEYLSSKGFLSILPDLRGFGMSGGPRAYTKSFSNFHKDLSIFHEWVRRAYPNLPVFFLGHSFGGLLVSSYAAKKHLVKSLDGLILTSPIFGTAFKIPLWKKIVAQPLSYLIPHYSEGNRVKTDALTHDKNMMELYKKDTLIYHKISVSLFRELNKMLAKRTRIAQKIHCPMLLLQAGDDRVVSKEKALKFFESVASSDKLLEVYDGWYHELLNETQRELIFEKIAAWLIRHQKKEA